MGHHGGMRRIGAIALWVLATLGSTALAWQAVDAVGVAGTGDFEATVLATIAPTAEVQPPDTTPETTTTATNSATQVAPETSPAAGSGITSSVAPTSTSSPVEAQAPTTTTTAGGPSTTTSTIATAPPTTTTASVAPPTTTQPLVITQTFFLTGGSVTVEFSEVSVLAIVSEPATGFSADVRQKSATEIDVRFDSPGHRSRLRAWWVLGPQSEIQD